MEIKEQPAKLEILPFAVRLPPSALRGPGEGATTVNPALAAVLHDTGVVGTITVMRKAVMIWFGWGKLEAENAVTEGESSSSSGEFCLHRGYQEYDYCALIKLTVFFSFFRAKIQ